MLRRRPSRAVRRPAGGPVATDGGPEICDDLAAWVATCPGATREVVGASFTVTRPLPRTIEPTVDDIFLSVASYDVPEQALVTIPRARVRSVASRRHQDLALVVLPDDRFVGELVALTPTGRRAMLRHQPAFTEPLPSRSTRMDGDWFVLLGFGTQHYYHWSHDLVMGASAVVDRLPPDARFLVPEQLRPFQLETLALLGIDERRLVHHVPGACWELERLHVVTPRLKTQVDHPAPFEWFRSAAFARFGLAPVAPTRRIHLSRRYDSHWRTTNEGDVEALLTARGFETVCPAQLTFREQVELFRQARAIVGTGAGLFNMVFAPAGAKVLQFQEQRHMIATLWTQAAAMGHEYHYVLGDSIDNPDADDADIHLPIPKLEAALEALDLD